MIRRFTGMLITCANRTAQALAIFLPVLTLLGTLVAWLEGWSLVRDGWYYGMVLGSTTGFGDLSPATIPGRLISVYLLLPIGLIGVGVIVGRVAATVIETRDAWKHEEQEQVKADAAAARADAAATRAEVERVFTALHAIAGGIGGEKMRRQLALPIDQQSTYSS